MVGAARTDEVVEGMVCLGDRFVAVLTPDAVVCGIDEDRVETAAVVCVE